MELLVRELKLPILDLNTLINNINSIGVQIPYLGYTEMEVHIPGIGHYDQNILMMVHRDAQCGKIKSKESGTQHMKKAIELASEKELAAFRNECENKAFHELNKSKKKPVEKENTQSQVLSGGMSCKSLVEEESSNEKKIHKLMINYQGSIARRELNFDKNCDTKSFKNC